MKLKAMSKKVRRIVSCGPLTYIECFQYCNCSKNFQLLAGHFSYINITKYLRYLFEIKIKCIYIFLIIV